MKFFRALRTHYILTTLAVLLIGAVVVVRLYFGQWVLQYVNEALDDIGEYHGSVRDIDLDLYRGAYRIHQLRIVKKGAGIPTPFVSIENVDLSIQWKSLIHGRIVSDIDLDRPVINYAVDPTGKQSQTGSGVDWTQPIKELAPIDINHVTFRHGKLSYQDFSAKPKVNVFINDMTGEVGNLRNVESDSERLPSPVKVNGDSIGGGRLGIKGRMNILKPIPDMDIAAQLVNVDLVALNDYSNAYASVDIKSGTLSVYSEFAVRNNHVQGYVKPIARNISLIDLRKDANPLKVAWESILSGLLVIFTNHHQDQFATKVQLEGDLSHVQTDTWSTIGGILHNAFISALQKGLDPQIK